MFLPLLLACAPAVTEGPPTPPATAPAAAPPSTGAERDLSFAATARWDLDGHVLTLEGATLHADGAAILAHVYDDPVQGDGVLWVPADPGEGDGGIYAVRVRDGALTVAPRLTSGRPDRLALSPDGGTLVYVGGHTGITSLWALPVAEGEPRQLTNLALTRTPGRAPAGFVPPPIRGPARFVGDRLVWTADIERTVAWR